MGRALTGTAWVAVAEPSASDASNSSSSASSDSSDESGSPSTSDEQSSLVESLSPSGPRVVGRSSGGADVSDGTDSETDDTEDVETTSTGDESLSEHDTSTASDEAEVTEPGENVVFEPDESVPADSEPVVESGGPSTEPKPTSNPAPESPPDPGCNAGPVAPQPTPNRRRIRRPNQHPIQCRMQALRLGCSRRRYRESRAFGGRRAWGDWWRPPKPMG